MYIAMYVIILAPKGLESHCIFLRQFIHVDESVLIKSVNVVVLGLCGALLLEKRPNLFKSRREVSLNDDDGKILSCDYDGTFYAEIINWATKPGQYVLFQHACSGR